MKQTHSHTDDAPSYEQMLRTSMAEVKEPGRLPSGKWVLRCVGAKNTPNDDREKADDPLGTVLLTHVPVAPRDEDAGGPGTETVQGGEWRGKRIFTRFNIRDMSDLFQVRQIVEGHGISAENSLEEGLEKMRGRSVEAAVGLRTYKSRGETRIENTLTNFVPA